MRILAFVLLGALFGGLNFAGCRSSPGLGKDQQLQLAGKSCDGEYRSLEDFRGRIVLVNIWASWCKPCLTELPDLNRIHMSRAQHDPRFSVLGVNVDSPSARVQVERIVNQFALKFPVILDPSSSFPHQIQAKGYPTSLLLNGQGKILWRRDGIITSGDAELNKEIDQALGLLATKNEKPTKR